MAETARDEVKATNVSNVKKLYTIEATVVTGFEETARGEAKEIFNTEVKAARGKITWVVPYNRIRDVLKMGSIDNFRVVMHTIPCFQFGEQNESLARLQKMVMDVDWESGLEVWKLFNDFPHNISPYPEVIPSPEDLVRVVVMKNVPAKQTKEEKKYKKGGNWKKKDKKTGSKKDGTNKQDFQIEGVTSQNNAVLEDFNTAINTGTDDVKVNANEQIEKDFRNIQLKKVMKSGEEKVEVEHAEVVGSKRHESQIEQIDSYIGDQKVPKTETIQTESQHDKETEICQVELHHLQETKSNPAESKHLSIIKSTQYDDVVEVSKVTALNYKEAILNDVKSNEKYLNSIEVTHVDETVANDVKLKCIDEKESNPEFKHVEETHTSKILDTGSNKSNEITVEKVLISDLQEPKIVIIKRREDWDKDTKIDIKVLLPNPDESVFPAKLRDLDDRILEPMDVDISSYTLTIDTSKENLTSPIEAKDSEICSNQIISEGLLPGPRENEFASSIIKKLTSPSKLRHFKGDTSPQNTATPPPTPTYMMPSVVSVPMSTSIVPNINTLDEGQSSVSGVTDELLSGPEQTLVTQLKESEIPSKKVVKFDPTKPKFRVTCYRNGDCHTFHSQSAAASFGSAVNVYHKWNVELVDYDIEVILDIDFEEVSVSLALSKKSMHYRNMVKFGPTTLRATICYNMLRLCRIKAGDIVCDPMCGSGAIPIEGAMSWMSSFHLGGDFHEKAVKRTFKNISALQNKISAEDNRKGLKIDVAQWNIEHFPLKDQCVDVFISDLPFGHRIGNRAGNRTLYPCLLSEMARTAVTGARACLLTGDKGNLIRAVNSASTLWQRRLVLNVNIGGLSAFVFLLTRTPAALKSGLTHVVSTLSKDCEAEVGGGDLGVQLAVSDDNVLTDKPPPANTNQDDSSQEINQPGSFIGNVFCE